MKAMMLRYRSSMRFLLPQCSSSSSSSRLSLGSSSRMLLGDSNRIPSAFSAIRFFSYEPLSKEEEEAEKIRVKQLTPFQKEMELRELDRQLAKLNMLRGINTGELYTLRGKFKMLARDYGIPFMIWYWTVWTTTAALCYTAIEGFGVDVMGLIAQADGYLGFRLAETIDPTIGTIGLTIAVNELIEPIRLPIVVLTTKPVVNFFMPPKY